jgi:spoIIIJ-associated protein
MQPERAKKIIEEILSLIGTPAESVTYTSDEKRGHIFSIKSTEFEKQAVSKPDLNKDIVYLFKRLFNKDAKLGEEIFKCTIDINDAQSKADESIKTKARNAAEVARNLKTDVLMDPMTSYERMVVHSTLAGCPDISTESVGEGRDRRLKVKYLAI